MLILRAVISPEYDQLDDVDTLYIDLSRYTSSPVAKFRSHIKYWMEKASWHKPSLLVFDNIDKLMGTELEVRTRFPVCRVCSLTRVVVHRTILIIARRLVSHTTHHRALPRAIRLLHTRSRSQCERDRPPCGGRVASFLAPAAELVTSLPGSCPPQAAFQGCSEGGTSHLFLFAQQIVWFYLVSEC